VKNVTKTFERCRRFVFPAFVLIAAAQGQGQVGTPIPSPFPGPEESFEAASVKPNRSGADSWEFDSPPGRVTGTNVVLRDLIRFAYNIYGGDWDIRIAGPEWIKTARFDIEATTAGAVPQARAMSMLRRLLAERFALKVHHENRERPVYELVRARPDGRLGPQITSNDIDCAALATANQAAIAVGKPPMSTFDPSKRPTCGSRSTGPNEISSGAFTMEQLAMQLSRPVGRPVINRTNLTGGFDFDLRWTPVQPTLDGGGQDTFGPSIFTALEEQLGLKLIPATGPVQVLVIDSVSQPTAN
jgi:uncharacterized protein (TIGR03435 family)